LHCFFCYSGFINGAVSGAKRVTGRQSWHIKRRKIIYQRKIKMFDLTGKRALVTGSSRGIGRAFALGLARKGADVVVHYVNNQSAAQEVHQEILSMGRTSVLVQADLTDVDCEEKIFAGLGHFGEIDILVLNAAIDMRFAWEDITGEECDRQLACNLRSGMLLTQKTVPSMKKNQWGRIIAVGSVQEKKPHPQMLIYSSAKAAQTHMMRSLALQLAEFGITVNSIAPGVIVTNRNEEVLQDPQYYTMTMNKIPMNRFGKPEDCVGALLLLCSEEGGYITGQNLYVDGGMGIK
jgi:NAD(P)-dependent dehydrogenase (short-subunit alcohol dehydrogenase family)